MEDLYLDGLERNLVLSFTLGAGVFADDIGITGFLSDSAGLAGWEEVM